VYECLLVIAPLQLTGGAGSPINPIAIGWIVYDHRDADAV
jgi:hypothetical protein